MNPAPNPESTGGVLPAPGSGLPAHAAAVQRLVAKASWRAIDFVSDCHLNADAPRTYAAWSAYLEQSEADAIFILGDLFELWIGDDLRASEPFLEQCASGLSAAAGRGKALFFMAGNRDFLLGPAMLASCAMQPLPDPALLDAFGQRCLLSHGDALCLDDVAYQAFRRQVRQPAWQADFLGWPLDKRLALARRLREDSQMRKDSATGIESWADIDGPEACAWLAAAGAETLIHGHTHRPQTGSLGPGLVRHVLPDWDFDTDTPRGGILRLDANGFRRLPPPALQAPVQP